MDRKTRKDYGQVTESFPAYGRVLRMLWTENGRQRVLQCMSDKIPLGGAPGKAGIEELRLVLEQMGKMRAGPPAESGSTATPAASGGSDPGATNAEEHDPVATQAAQEEKEAGNDGLEAPEEVKVEEEDPVELRLRSLVERQLAHVAIHEDIQKFETDVKSRTTVQRVVALIDAVALASLQPRDGSDSSSIGMADGE